MLSNFLSPCPHTDAGMAQVCQELSQKREAVLERACSMDDEFSKRERAYKTQVWIFLCSDCPPYRAFILA